MKKTDYRRELIREDCLEVFRNGHIEAGSVDLIYLDPPFNSKQKYNLPFKKLGKDAEAVEAFKDIWHWDESTKDLYRQLSKNKETVALKDYIDNLSALRGGRDDMTAYLVNMAIRLFEMRKVLKPTGVIFLHCDPTASHYLKIMMDAIYGKDNFLNEIIWHYTGGGRSKKYFSKKHDIIFWYRKDCKQKEWIFNIDEVRVPYKKTSGYAKSGIKSKAGKRYLPNPKGTPVDDVWGDIPVVDQDSPDEDVWYIPIINPTSPERVGYPTQKPIKLLERIISACSDKGALVLDPFCGCGTTIHAAENLGRQWIGIDISRFSVGVM